ncbi:MAG: hypothetical protein KBT05_00700 [Bacteroidales bacterium]|nr:hypothetical protein [Candidatus Cryptobacteroides caccocaballi]
MQNKLQELTDKLYNEGLSKGKLEGEELVAKAKAQAEAIVADAKSQAEAIVAQARKEAEDIKSKVASDVRMASRESVAATKQDIENLIISKITADSTKKALSESDFVKSIIKAVAEKFSAEESADIALVLPESLKSELEPFIQGELASILKGEVAASFSKKIAGGFTIGPKDGSYFISLTDETLQELIGAYLRPATKKILFG